MQTTRTLNSNIHPDERRSIAIQGALRADRRTKDLVKRLKPGDIAVIHHVDLDSTAARSLVDCRVGAVVNAVRSISGRYPNNGPRVLLEAGIQLIDGIGEDFFELALGRDGKSATIEGNSISFADGISGHGELVTEESMAQQLELARENLNGEIDAFARNTLEYLVAEKGLLLDPVEIPDIKTNMRGKHVMVVVRGEGYKDDLDNIQQYITEVRPVLIGVDGGADALLELGLKPNLIIGDMDSVSDTALRCGAELVVHGYANGNRETPGLRRLEGLGLKSKVFHSPGTSEDIAMILADEKGASLIVAVGTHFSLVEFLDKGRGGMASTFLVRLRIGAKLVDAKGTGRLWAHRRKGAAKDIIVIFLVLCCAALFPLLVLTNQTPLGRMITNFLRLKLRLH